MAKDELVLCNDTTSLSEAVNILKKASHVILDCEGEILGKIGGRMSLIGCRIPGKAFVIDVQSISKNNLSPLYDLLGSPKPYKVMYDGRMDFSELFHGSGIRLSGVIDLQIADICSRAVRGEGVEAQLRRLSPYIPSMEIMRNRGPYVQIHKLNGLADCLKEHGIPAEKLNPLNHRSWLERPIRPQLLEYLANDLRMIEMLLGHFVEKRFISSHLIEQSQRYIEIPLSKRPPSGGGHPLLPLGILDPPSFPSTNLCCTTCARNLPIDCFRSVNGQVLTLKGDCWVCRAVLTRNSMQTRREMDLDDLDDLLFNDNDNFNDDFDDDHGFGSWDA